MQAGPWSSSTVTKRDLQGLAGVFSLTCFAYAAGIVFFIKLKAMSFLRKITQVISVKFLLHEIPSHFLRSQRIEHNIGD